MSDTNKQPCKILYFLWKDTDYEDLREPYEPGLHLWRGLKKTLQEWWHKHHRP